MDVSVCIPALNSAETIGDQLAALGRQHFDGTWEVVVADNGSTDATRQVVESQAEAFPVRLAVVDAGDLKGVAHARNVAAAAAEGRVVAFCDADDVVFPGWLEAVASSTAQRPAVVGFNHELREPLDESSPVINPDGVLRSSHGSVGYGGNLALEYDVLRAVGGFNERFVGYGPEDTDFFLRLIDAGHELKAAHGMRIHYRLPSSSPRSVLRKRWSYASYEVLLWTLHPHRFPGQARIGRLICEAGGLPVRVIRRLRTAGVRSFRESASDTVVCVARIVGWWRFARDGAAARG